MHEHDLVEAIRALEDECAHEPFDDSQKERWNELNAELDEYKVRRQRLAELGRRPENTEHGDGAHQPPVITRIDEAAPAHVRAGHDAGLRTIERNLGTLSPAAADNLDRVIRGHDPLGLGGQYLDAVASAHYTSAFGKMVAETIRWFSPDETLACASAPESPFSVHHRGAHRRPCGSRRSRSIPGLSGRAGHGRRGR
jgi:hypothetical protein